MSLFMTKTRAQQILQAQIEAKELQEKKDKEQVRSQAKTLWQRLGGAGNKDIEEDTGPKERYLKKASGKGMPNFNYLKNKILERNYQTKSPEKRRDTQPKEKYLKKQSGPNGQPDKLNLSITEGRNNFDKKSSVEPEYDNSWKKIKGALNSDSIINQMKSQLVKFHKREVNSAKN